MDPKPSIAVEWAILGGKPQVAMQIVLNTPGIVVAEIPNIGSLATLTLEPQAAHTLALILKDKAEAAARKAGIVLESKLGHEAS